MSDKKFVSATDRHVRKLVRRLKRRGARLSSARCIRGTPTVEWLESVREAIHGFIRGYYPEPNAGEEEWAVVRLDFGKNTSLWIAPLPGDDIYGFVVENGVLVPPKMLGSPKHEGGRILVVETTEHRYAAMYPQATIDDPAELLQTTPARSWWGCFIYYGGLLDSETGDDVLNILHEMFDYQVITIKLPNGCVD